MAAILDVAQGSLDTIMEDDHPSSITSNSKLAWTSGWMLDVKWFETLSWDWLRYWAKEHIKNIIISKHLRIRNKISIFLYKCIETAIYSKAKKILLLIRMYGRQNKNL